MPEVYAWPPVTVSGWANGTTRPGSTSYGLNGAPYYSQAQAARQTYSVNVLSAGRERGSSGYLDMLRRQLDGKPPLVRVYPLPPLHHSTFCGLLGLRGQAEIDWMATGRDMVWDIEWAYGTVIDAVAEADGDWDAIRCTGLPASRTVAYPGEIVRADTGETARVLKREVSDEDGEALIRLDGPLPDGEVLIGAIESVVMEITKWHTPSTQMEPGTLSLTMREIFDTDYDTAFTEVDPWS